ncbi:hypothetical protein EDC01DRAFT_764981 [Geopyxis carbonaria]|nr:hypothetical protein EDC01DRAFT_764981 [Geopyxis carbonaria]
MRRVFTDTGSAHSVPFQIKPLEAHKACFQKPICVCLLCVRPTSHIQLAPPFNVPRRLAHRPPHAHNTSPPPTTFYITRRPFPSARAYTSIHSTSRPFNHPTNRHKHQKPAPPHDHLTMSEPPPTPTVTPPTPTTPTTPTTPPPTPTTTQMFTQLLSKLVPGMTTTAPTSAPAPESEMARAKCFRCNVTFAVAAEEIGGPFARHCEQCRELIRKAMEGVKQASA